MNVKDNLLVGAFTAKQTLPQTLLKSIPSFRGWQSAKLRKQQPNLEETPNGVPRSRAHDVSVCFWWMNYYRARAQSLSGNRGVLAKDAR